MNEITILDELPVVFTKDRSFIVEKLTPGTIVFLPDDAVLAMIPPMKYSKPPILPLDLKPGNMA